MSNTRVIRNERSHAYTIMHAVGDRKTAGELEAEGYAFAREHSLGDCTIAAHHDAIHGDHVHILVKE